MKLKVKPKTYLLFSADNPLPASMGTTWSKIYEGPNKTVEDTIGVGKIKFYKVQAKDKTGTQLSDLSWPEGGSTLNCPVNNAGVIAKMLVWEDAHNCISQYVNRLEPDPMPGMSRTIDGEGGSTHFVELYLDTSSGWDAVAEFTWTGDFTMNCTNDVAMNGWNYAPVNIATFDGFLRGYLEFADGWEAFYLVVENKETTGRHFYASDDTTVSYVDYAEVPTAGCTTCDEPDNCCPIIP